MSTGTIADLVRRNATLRPGEVALSFGADRWTFTELDERSSRTAQALAAEGVRAQDRVAYFGKNTPEFFHLLLGASKLNAVTVAVNWRLSPREVAYILDDARVQVVVVEEAFVPVLDAVGDQLSDVTRIVVGGDGELSFERWVSRAPDGDPSVEADVDDVALQLYTSGTTGLPKGAMITHANLATMLPNTAKAWYFGADSVNLVAMPLFHVGGVGWALVGMHAGAETVLLHEVAADEILRAIPRHRVTHALFVPAVLQALLATPGVEAIDFSSLEYIVYGASPIAIDVLTRSLERFRCGFIQGYGLTETTGAVVHLLPEDHDPTGPNVHRLRAAGRPMADVEMRIVDPRSGRERAAGDVGEVLLRSPQVMRSYWNRPEDTAEVLDADRWFRTGDAGYVDGDGYLYISDRVKDMIISGGENIYPAEIENALMSCDGIADAAVIGVPSDKWGETPRAIVVLADGAQLSPDDVIAHCRAQLAGYKCPTSVEFVAELPRNAAGKILKRELRAPHWEQHERDVN